MSVFKDDMDTKRVIFNVRLDLARRLEIAKKEAREIGKKLDVDTTIDRALEKFLKKAEKKISEIKKKENGPREEGDDDSVSYESDFDQDDDDDDSEEDDDEPA